MPDDLRWYFLTVNGTKSGAYGMDDPDLMAFCHIDEVETFARVGEGGDRLPRSAATTFAIADHSIWV